MWAIYIILKFCNSYIWKKIRKGEFKKLLTHYTWDASQVVQLVKNLPAIQEISVQFLGPEVPLDDG